MGMEIEEGKYVSVGHSILVRKSKNGDYTYYHNYRDKETKKPKRRKLFTKSLHSNKNIKDCIRMIEVKEEVEENSFNTPNSTYTLNILAENYFNSRKIQMISKLKQEYNYLSNDEFFENEIIKRKLTNLKSESQKYNKNVSNSKIAKMNFDSITKVDINRFVDLELTNNNLSQKSVSVIVSLIKTIVNKGMEQEYISINPFQYIKVKNPKRTRVRYLNTEELKLLLNKCKEYESNFNVYLSVYLAVLTAGRARTILNIQKKDIDIKNKQIRLNNFKSSKYYVIQLNKESIEWLDKKILKNINGNDYLIQPTNENDRKIPQQPLCEIPEKVYEIMDELFNQNLDKSNNNDRDFVVNFHTLRRSVATNLALQGSNIYDIMTLLNHSSIKQTEDYLSLNNNSLSTETNKLLSSIFD
ncbi:tyrosine-type recombinase/integrase [Sulfurimonas xiamenensis]|uniref:Tyr recombinase domain-containing protein n=1 Tax=Sulfurimonas xiamenensis TaxID=2590021 RepID=A0AAJ4A520_9BACT|nr:tyrosine-type recombinase/integrase [Sulfurimonas xiamenensis]QFR44059.1 hypothetical protein FJR47_09070 [Sulfurimonas xiamenensis]